MFLTAFAQWMLDLNYSLQVHQQKTMQDAHIAANNLILVRDAYQI